MQANKIYVNNNTIAVKAVTPSWANSVELRFTSAQNCPVSRMSNISSTHPAPKKAIDELENSTGDILFPFVDLKLQKNSILRLEFENPTGEYVFDPFFL